MSGLRAAAWLLAVLAAAAALAALAHWQLASALDARSRALLAAASRGEAMAAWPLSDAEDIIAGRVFGHAGFRFDAAGLHVTSQGEAVEFGLRLGDPLDLRRYGALSLSIHGDPRIRYQWAAYFAGAAGPCRSEPLAAIDDRLDVRLDRLEWQCHPSGTIVTSLRLVVDGPSGAVATFGNLAIRPNAPLDVANTERIPLIDTAERLGATLPALVALPATEQPVAIMPLDPFDAAGLARRARARAAVPGLIAFTTRDAVAPSVEYFPLSQRITPFLFALLLGSWRWPPRSPRARVAVELVAALAMPLWLTVGLRLGTPMNPLDRLFCVAGAIYLWRRVAERSIAWRWIGGLAAWQLPAASVAVALIVAWPLRDASAAASVDALAMLRYLGWAGVQQLIVSRCIADRLTTLGWSVPWISLGAALAFALLHAPNQSLMLLTLLGGLLWTWNWQRHRALLPNVVAHAVCGAIATGLIGRDWLWSAEAGSRFFAG